MENPHVFDVLIIGAGPSGSCAAALLTQKGFSVGIIERELFPRFSIGESLLPQSMVYLKNAGLLDAVNKIGFQKKDGATFLADGVFSVFNFADKFTEGPYETFQVQRDIFDKTLADTAEKMGAHIFYQHNVDKVTFDENTVRLQTTDLTNKELKTFEGKFVLDASGFGRTLPRLLNLNKPSVFPPRRAVFGHMNTKFPESFDTNKILISVDDHDKDVWFWTIPFPNNTCSMGIVATEEYYKSFGEASNKEILEATIARNPKLQELMTGAELTTDVRTIMGYANDVTTLHGPQFALLGNAGEFLDPIFSSGVTIALHSASLAAELVEKELKGQKPDWEKEFSEPLKVGVSTFKTFVGSWYTGELQSIIFYPKPEPRIKQMICSVLAGYAWDKKNPYVAESKRNVATLAAICSGN